MVDDMGWQDTSVPFSDQVTSLNKRYYTPLLTDLCFYQQYLYESPEINDDMPGIGYDKALPNEDIAELLSFIRKSWQNNASPVTKEEVAHRAPEAGRTRKSLHRQGAEEVGGL